jgi:hypothetical protein
MDPEDIAVTGAGIGEKSWSWLYDFEEQEGELDFLMCVAVFTFYQGTPRTPITIGEVLSPHASSFSEFVPIEIFSLIWSL